MLRVWLIDGGARQSDPGDCDDDDLQCGMILFFLAVNNNSLLSGKGM